MSFIKLCEPKLDASQEAVLERISQLERAVKNAGAVQQVIKENVAPTVSEHQNDPPAAQPEPKQNENYAQSAGTQPEKPEIPVKAEAEKQPQQPPMPTVQAAPEQGGISEFEHWAEFMDIIHKTDIALFGVLSGAGAHFDSGRFVIDSPNPTIKQFIQIPTHLKAIKQAVAEITGMAYKIAVSKPKAQNNQQRDLLEDLINKAQNNIEIKFE